MPHPASPQTTLPLPQHLLLGQPAPPLHYFQHKPIPPPQTTSTDNKELKTSETSAEKSPAPARSFVFCRVRVPEHALIFKTWTPPSGSYPVSIVQTNTHPQLKVGRVYKRGGRIKFLPRRGSAYTAPLPSPEKCLTTRNGGRKGGGVFYKF